MNKLLPLSRVLPFIGILTVAQSLAADIKVAPRASLGISATDNVQLGKTDKTSSAIAEATAAAEISIEGKQANLQLDYKATKALYSHDSARNVLYHQLSLSGQRASVRDGWQVNVRGDIRNTPRSLSLNASDDLLVGDLVELRSLVAGVGYSNRARGPLSVELSASTSIQSSEDNVGDSTSTNASLSLGQGRLVKGSFWDLDYAASEQRSANTNRINRSHTFSYQLGTQFYKNWSPFINTYAEKFNQNDEETLLEIEQRFVRVGPGLRYSFSKQSYIQLSYDDVLEGEQADSLGAKLLWQPSRRTKLQFDYGVRYFGKSYDFSLSHRNKLWTNSIRYTEGPDSFNRENAIDDENIEDLALTKTLTWTSSLAMRRSTFALSVYARFRNSGLSDEGSSNRNDTLGARINYQRELNAGTDLSLSLNYTDYSFGQTLDQKDEYYSVKATMSHILLNTLLLDYGASLTSRTSSNEEFGYDENRLFLNMTKQF